MEKSAGLMAQQTQWYLWIMRYKLHHIPFWFAYHFMWWTLRIGSPAAVLASMMYPPGTVKFFFYMVLQMVAVYFNLYFLLPKFLEKGKYITYVLLFIMTIVGFACIITTGYYVSAAVADKSVREMYGAGFFSLFESGALPSTAAAMTLALSIKLTKNWMQTRNREKELEREKLETELKFLRSQMNPHFLFNTINSIFVLITKNPTVASQSLAKFSELLRYQLYECNEPQIPLGRELTYVGNFIELQSLRQDHDYVDLKVNIDGRHAENFSIAPFVIIPFIENAFKHVSRYDDRSNWIIMNIAMKENYLHFSIENSVSVVQMSSTEAVRVGGIGLQNVKRRLDLTYPDHYQLLITEKPDCYKVKLEVALQECSMSSEMKMAINK
jgi:sensor histidine kinase YesM